MSNARDIADAGHQLVGWANFSFTADTIRASYNITSISSPSDGTATVSLASSAQSDTNYCVVASTDASASVYANNVRISNFQTGSFDIKINTSESSNTFQDSNLVCVAVFR